MSYEDLQGFCKSANIEEVRRHEYILTPGRYVGIEEVEADGEPFAEKMTRLTELWIVPGAKHVGAYSVRPDQFIEKVTKFFVSSLLS